MLFVVIYEAPDVGSLKEYCEISFESKLKSPILT